MVLFAALVFDPMSEVELAFTIFAGGFTGSKYIIFTYLQTTLAFLNSKFLMEI